jgi:hypothetical protein
MKPAPAHAAASTAAVSSEGWPLLRLALRPFYLLAAAAGVLLPLLWTGLYAGVLPWQPALPGVLWHAHEMVFGFVVAAIVGFLFTAGRLWTGLSMPTCRFLAAFALLCLGRAACHAADALAPVGGVWPPDPVDPACCLCMDTAGPGPARLRRRRCAARVDGCACLGRRVDGRTHRRHDEPHRAWPHRAGVAGWSSRALGLRPGVAGRCLARDGTAGVRRCRPVVAWHGGVAVVRCVHAHLVHAHTLVAAASAGRQGRVRQASRLRVIDP